jgi:hypothetical protein
MMEMVVVSFTFGEVVVIVRREVVFCNYFPRSAALISMY